MMPHVKRRSVFPILGSNGEDFGKKPGLAELLNKELFDMRNMLARGKILTGISKIKH